MYRYYLSTDIHEEKEVTQEEFIKFERNLGFFPKPGCGPVATGGFSKNGINGRTEWIKEKGEPEDLRIRNILSKITSRQTVRCNGVGKTNCNGCLHADEHKPVMTNLNNGSMGQDFCNKGTFCVSLNKRVRCIRSKDEK